MLFSYILIHATIFAIIFTLYLFAIMRGLSPRVCAMSDYPPEITDHVPPQTDAEKRQARIVYIPFLVIGIAYPLAATYFLKILNSGVISFLDAFLSVFVILIFGFLADYIILDFLIVGTLTPDFVILPGTEHMRDKEYKDFRKYHAKGHIKGLLLIVILSLLLAAVVWIL
ncbi:MAG: hypothetical protein ACFFDJ_06290 [Candidatus Odinarchaeota archaeon]